MTPEQWARVARVYEAALECEPAARAELLADACANDDDLRREVDSLLAQDTTPVVVDRALLDVASDVLETESVLASDTTLGPYRIDRLVGSGGMGQVYRATDTRLNRAVAIKVLPTALALDEQFSARFQREARTLASLTHSNICALYDVGRARVPAAGGGEQESDYLVLEYLEGETLAARLERGALPFEEALSCAIQIADALHAAHRRGIVHRDLKPGNVFLVATSARSVPSVKLLDFGLARPTSPGVLGHNAAPMPTGSAPLTQQGTILGTLQYMAPEQIEGLDADARTDIFALGGVVHEMFTGKKAFAGKSQASLLGAIMQAEPPSMSSVQPLTPSFLERIVKKCLAKDPEQRWQSAADVAAQLRWLAESGTDGSVIGQGQTRARRRAWPLAALSIVAAAGLAVAAWRAGAGSVPLDRPVARFAIPVPASDLVTNGRNLLSLSSDGKTLAYVAGGGAQLRFLDRLEPVPLRGAEGGQRVGGTTTSDPFFSPDGQWVGFWQDRELKKVSIGGGAPVVIAESVRPFLGGTMWRDDGTILVAEPGRIVRMSEAGREVETVASGLNGVIQSAELLPNRGALLYTLLRPNAQPEVIVRRLQSGEEHTLLRGAIQAQYLPTGHLVYFQDGTLRAVPFDLRTLSLRGSPVPVIENVASSGIPGNRVSAAHFAVSPSGTLAYISGPFIEAAPRTLVWVDRFGREEPVGAPDRAYVAPRLSPDEGRIAVTIRDDERDIWIWDMARKSLSRFTHGPSEDRYSLWTLDGARIAFGSNRDGDAGVWWQASDGSGTPERLAGFPLGQFTNFIATTVAPDGTMIASAFGGPTRSDLWKLPLAGDRRAGPLLQTPAAELNAEISPDGRWLAYESEVAGRFEIHLRPFPDVTRQMWQVSNGGGTQARWAASGRELFFLDATGTLMSARIDDRMPPATPTKVLDRSYVWIVPTYAGRMYDVARDGKRFLMLKPVRSEDAGPTMTNIVVVQNWFEELRRLVR
jgi:serine/threonine-protein kinase